MTDIEITQGRLETARRSLEAMMNGRKFGIRQRIAESGRRHDDGLAERSMEASLSCLGVIDILWNRAAQTGLLDKESALPSVFATEVAAQYAQSLLDILPERGNERVASRDSFEGESIDFTRIYPLFLDDILAGYSRALDRSDGAGPGRVTSQLFSWMKARADSEGERLRDYGKKTEGIKVVICGDFEFEGSAGRLVRANPIESKYTWENFGGYREAVQYFQDIGEIVKRYGYCLSLNVMDRDDLLPKGILLSGPPGTGKTRLARTFCHETGAPFEMFGVSEVGSSFVYETCLNVQRRFDAASRYVRAKDSPVSVIFIDELDAIGKSRSRLAGGGSEDDKVVTALCENMDGHLAVGGVMVIGATNLPGSIDSALIRPERFGKILQMGPVDQEDARQIFSIYLPEFSQKAINRLVDQYVAPTINEAAREPQYQNVFTGIWTGALIKQVEKDARRRKLVQHLRHDTDYRITEQDVFNEIGICLKGGW